MTPTQTKLVAEAMNSAKHGAIITEPATVLALIARIQELEKEAKQLREDVLEGLPCHDE